MTRQMRKRPPRLMRLCPSMQLKAQKRATLLPTVQRLTLLR
jgi:hypothetical protein